MLNSLLTLSSINIKLTEVTIAAIWPAPYFNFPYGFMGIYCFRKVLALVFEHCLIHSLFTVRKLILKSAFKPSRNCRTLYSLSKFLSPGRGILELSVKWRLLHISKNLFLGITLEMASDGYSWQWQGLKMLLAPARSLLSMWKDLYFKLVNSAEHSC